MRNSPGIGLELRTVEEGNVAKVNEKLIPNLFFKRKMFMLHERMKRYMEIRVRNHPLRLLTEGHFPFLNREVLNDIQRRVEIKISEELEKANVKNNNETTGWDKVREVVRKCIFIDNSNGFGRIFARGDEGIKINLYEDEDDTWKKFCEVFENAIRDQDSWSMLQEIILENIPVM